MSTPQQKLATQQIQPRRSAYAMNGAVGRPEVHWAHTVESTTESQDQAIDVLLTGANFPHLLRLSIWLQQAGYVTFPLAEAEQVAQLLTGVNSPAVVIFNAVGLPAAGLPVYQQLCRMSQVPVLVLTEPAHVQIYQDVMQDVLEEAHGHLVIAAQNFGDIMLALHRRQQEDVTGPVLSPTHQIRRLEKATQTKFSPLQRQILTVFMEHPDTIVSMEMIMTAIWGEATPEAVARVRVHIMHIRGKLAVVPELQDCLKTVHGRGYLLRSLPL